jgi:ComF family protein
MARLPWPSEVEEEVAMVLPVPLSRVRARERGYNQSAAMANEIARLKGWHCDIEILARGRSNSSQTTLHPTERRANVAGAFEVSRDAACRIGGQHLLLIDDVWTTGATALSCADALLDAGARAVSVLTFARALPDLERNTRRVELARR